MPPLQLALFLGVMFPLLGALAYYAGFEKRLGWRDALLWCQRKGISRGQ
jgi:uncharacterized membrane protein